MTMTSDAAHFELVSSFARCDLKCGASAGKLGRRLEREVIRCLMKMTLTWSQTVMMLLSDFGLFGIDRYEEMTASCSRTSMPQFRVGRHSTGPNV
jgi:hypothetical protein